MKPIFKFPPKTKQQIMKKRHRYGKYPHFKNEI